MIIRVRTIIVCILVSTMMLFAQENIPTLKWTGDFRVRTEIDGRDFDLSTPPNTFTLLRARIALDAMPAENVRVFIQVRDSRLFGQEKDNTNAFSTTADIHNIDLHQGYVEVKKLLLDEMTLKLGKMELNYGSERLIGAVGWHNIGRTFDGGLLRFDLSSLSMDIFAMNIGEVHNAVVIATPASVAYLQDVETDFFGIYSSMKNLTNEKIDGYLLYQSNRNRTIPDEIDLSRFTLGGYGKGTFDAIDYEAELAYQGGRQRGVDISAYMVTGNIGYSFQNSTVARVGLGVELLSGTSPGDTKFKVFDPPYPTGHKFYGFMDYFITIPSNTGNLGLIDGIAKSQFKYSDQWSTNVWVHYFRTHQDGGAGTDLGQEIDLVTLYKHNKNLFFELGISGFVPGSLMQARFKHSDTAFWGYLTTSVNF